MPAYQSKQRKGYSCSYGKVDNLELFSILIQKLPLRLQEFRLEFSRHSTVKAVKDGLILRKLWLNAEHQDIRADTFTAIFEEDSEYDDESSHWALSFGSFIPPFQFLRKVNIKFSRYGLGNKSFLWDLFHKDIHPHLEHIFIQNSQLIL